MAIKHLKSYLLISTNTLNDSIFKKSIIIVCEHNRHGAMGLIVNKPILPKNNNNSFINIIFNEIELDSKIYFGGPVNLQNCYVLHDSNYKSKDTIHISKNLSFTSNDKIIDDIKNNVGPKNYKINLGYAGWNKGQLEQEIDNGDWFVKPIAPNFIFSVSDDKMWEQSTQDLGFNIQDFLGQSGQA